MPEIVRSALVEQPAERMFDLVNDVAAYPQRFRWCDKAEILEEGPQRLVARLDLGLGSFRTWFMTENTLQRPASIDMRLKAFPGLAADHRTDIDVDLARIADRQFQHGFFQHLKKPLRNFLLDAKNSQRRAALPGTIEGR